MTDRDWKRMRAGFSVQGPYRRAPRTSRRLRLVLLLAGALALAALLA